MCMCTPTRKTKALTKVILFSILATLYQEKIRGNFLKLLPQITFLINKFLTPPPNFQLHKVHKISKHSQINQNQNKITTK